MKSLWGWFGSNKSVATGDDVVSGESSSTLHLAMTTSGHHNTSPMRGESSLTDEFKSMPGSQFYKEDVYQSSRLEEQGGSYQSSGTIYQSFKQDDDHFADLEKALTFHQPTTRDVPFDISINAVHRTASSSDSDEERKETVEEISKHKSNRQVSQLKEFTVARFSSSKSCTDASSLNQRLLLLDDHHQGKMHVAAATATSSDNRYKRGMSLAAIKEMLVNPDDCDTRESIELPDKLPLTPNKSTTPRQMYFSEKHQNTKSKQFASGIMNTKAEVRGGKSNPAFFSQIHSSSSTHQDAWGQNDLLENSSISAMKRQKKVPADLEEFLLYKQNGSRRQARNRLVFRKTNQPIRSDDSRGNSSSAGHRWTLNVTLLVSQIITRRPKLRYMLFLNNLIGLISRGFSYFLLTALSIKDLENLTVFIPLILCSRLYYAAEMFYMLFYFEQKSPSFRSISKIFNRGFHSIEIGQKESQLQQPLVNEFLDFEKEKKDTYAQRKAKVLFTLCPAEINYLALTKVDEKQRGNLAVISNFIYQGIECILLYPVVLFFSFNDQSIYINRNIIGIDFLAISKDIIIVALFLFSSFVVLILIYGNMMNKNKSSSSRFM